MPKGKEEGLLLGLDGDWMMQIPNSNPYPHEPVKCRGVCIFYRVVVYIGLKGVEGGMIEVTSVRSHRGGGSVKPLCPEAECPHCHDFSPRGRRVRVFYALYYYVILPFYLIPRCGKDA